MNANGMPDPRNKKRKRPNDEGGASAEGLLGERQETQPGHGARVRNNPKVAGGKQASKSPQRKIKSGKVMKKKVAKKLEVKTVIFVPQTANSKLAKMLRRGSNP